MLPARATFIRIRIFRLGLGRPEDVDAGGAAASGAGSETIVAHPKVWPKLQYMYGVAPVLRVAPMPSRQVGAGNILDAGNGRTQ